MDEELVVLDEFGKPTGETVPRGKAHQKGILHGASHLFIYRQNSDGRIDFLLQKRSLNKDSFPGQLDMSSGGHMIKGMDFESTAIKELEEELGIIIKKEELKYAFEYRICHTNSFHGKLFVDNEINKIYVLDKNINPSELTLQEEEVAEVIWMDSEEISRRLVQRDPAFCLSFKEFNDVLNFIKQKLQESNHGLEYLQVKTKSVTKSQETQKTQLEDDGIEI